MRNEEAQSASERGGKEPVTGFHSVMLNLEAAVNHELHWLILLEDIPRFGKPSEAAKDHYAENAGCAS